MKQSSPCLQASKSSKRPAEDAGLDLSPKPVRRSRKSRDNGDNSESHSSSTHSTLDTTTVLNPTSPPLPDVTDTEPHIKSVGTPVPPVEDAIENGGYDFSTRPCDVEESRHGPIDDLQTVKISHPQKTSDLERNEGDSFIAASTTQSPTNEETTKADRDDGDQKLDEANSEAASTEPDANKRSLLPLELHRLILGYFWNDKQVNCKSYRTLRSCALTCSRWRAAARPYIFRFLILRGSKDFDKLTTQLREEPGISGWIQKIRLEGKSVPYQDVYRRPLDGVEKDLDTGLYSFPTILGQPLSNVHILELVGFAQVSSRRADWEAFAKWIPRLATMTSITALYLVRCQMSPNSLTAIVRALHGLRRLALTVSVFSHPNTCVLREEEISATFPHPLEAELLDHDSPSGVADATAVVDSVDNHVESNKKSSDGPIPFPIFYPPPALQTLLIDTAPLTEYPRLEFEHIAGWFHAGSLSKCLEYLEIGTNVLPSCLNRMLMPLGQSSNLQHLHVSTFLHVLEDIEIDISHLVNLRTLCLYGVDDDEWEAEDEIPRFQKFLSQIPGNMPHLEDLTIVFYVDEDINIADLGVLDEYLAGDNFSRVKRMTIALYPSPLTQTWSGLRNICKKIRQQFPLLDKRGILTVTETKLNYPNYTIGID